MIAMSLSSGDLVRDLTGAPGPSPEGAHRIPAGDPAMVLVRYPAAGRPCGRSCGEDRPHGRSHGAGTPQAPVAALSARAVSTVARCDRYSDDPCRSVGGSVPAVACAAAVRNTSSDAGRPLTAVSTALARTGTGPMLVSATRASSIPSPLRRTAHATPTIAHACAVRLNFS